MDEFENAETVSNLHAKKDEEKEVREDASKATRALSKTHHGGVTRKKNGTYPGRRNVN